MENTTKVMHLLDELERILNHAQASLASVLNAKDPRLEELNFMQLTRDSERCIHILKQELQPGSLNHEEALRMDARLYVLWSKAVHFGEDILTQAQLEHVKQLMKKQKAAGMQISSNPISAVAVIHYLWDYVDSDSTQEDPYNHRIPVSASAEKPNEKSGSDYILPAIALAAELLRKGWNYYQKNRAREADAKAKEMERGIALFKQTTAEFCTVLQMFDELYQQVHQRLQQLEEEAREAEEKKRSKGGRTESCWYAGSWDGWSEEAVREKLREIYSKTIDGLDGLKSDNRSPNNVWAALFFCAAKGQGIILEKIRPNNVDYERDLNAAGIKASKNSIKKYHTYCRLFHLGGEPDAGQLHSVSRWLELLRQKATEAVKRYVEETHRSLTKEAEEWLADDAKGITIDRKFWEGLSHDYPLYSGVFERIGGGGTNFFQEEGEAWQVSG